MSGRSHAVFAGALALAGGCWPSPPEAPPPATILGLEPEGAVDPGQVMALAFSGPVRPRAPDWPVEVSRLDGRSVPLALPSADWTTRLPLVPSAGWPPGETLLVRVGSGLVDEQGRALLGPEAAPSFVVRGPEVPRAIGLRAPRPGERWPLNLRTLALTISPAEQAMHALWLHGAGQRLRLELLRREEAQLLVRLPEHRGPCLPLCGGATYRLELETPEGVIESAEIWTSTQTDRLAPRLQLLSVAARGTGLAIDVLSDEPVLLHGWVRAQGGHEVELVGPLVPGLVSRVVASAPLAPNVLHLARVEAEDLAGLRAEGLLVEVETRARPEVRITEMVLSPLRDWGDSEPAGEPFDAQPGQGAVSSADQWVELVNHGAEPLDLRAAELSLRAIDTSPTETWLASAPAHHFGSGGDLSRWWPGEALVLRLRGQMSKTKLVLELRQGDALLDRVEIGRSSTADHVGGSPPDLEHEAVARDATGRFRFCVPSPGDPSPPSRCLLR